MTLLQLKVHSIGEFRSVAAVCGIHLAASFIKRLLVVRAIAMVGGVAGLFCRNGEMGMGNGSGNGVRVQTLTNHAAVRFHGMRRLSPTNLTPHRPVQRAVVDRLEYLVPADAFGTREIGQRAGDFQNTVVCTRAEVVVRHGLLEEARAFAVEFTMFTDEPRSHAAVGMDTLLLRKTLALDAASAFDPFANGLRAFGLFG